jgi:arylsulfatase A-like enzyme
MTASAMSVFKPGFIAMTFSLTAQGSSAAQKPNIILICADDMGYGDAGCYGGSNLVPVPNIDRLAAEGIRFTDGYVTAPMCGPSRYGMLTGAYQQRFGIQDNKDCYADLPGVERIPASQKLIHEALSGAGYVTGIVGKWNLPGYPKTSFDETLSVIHFGADYWPNAQGHYVGVDEPVARSNSKRAPFWGPPKEGDEHLTDRLGRQSVEFINRHADKPFFLYLAFNAPHSPLEAKQSHYDAVKHLPSEALRFYGALLLSMDENIGRVLDALDAHGLAGNTLIAFISDNGPTFAFNVAWPSDWPKELLGSAGPLRGQKSQLFEGGLRVPYLLRWPEKFQGGQVYHHAVSALDFYPTFCAAAGAAVPDGTQLDGINLLPFLRGETAGAPHDILFWNINDQGAVRRGDWKLKIYRTQYSLYNLGTDIGETTDVRTQHPEITADLLSRYQQFCSGLPAKVNP